MTAAAGTGVARRRLSTPASRCAVTEMTRLNEGGGDHAEGDDAQHVRDGGVDPPAGDLDCAAGAADDGGEDDKEQDWQGEGEELGLAVAKEGSQVVAELVDCHAD